MRCAHALCTGPRQAQTRPGLSLRHYCQCTGPVLAVRLDVLCSCRVHAAQGTRHAEFEAVDELLARHAGDAQAARFTE